MCELGVKLLRTDWTGTCSYDVVVYCSVCGQEYQRTGFLAHSYIVVNVVDEYGRVIGSHLECHMCGHRPYG